MSTKLFGVKSLPVILHYAIGNKKVDYLNKLLPALEWKYGKYIAPDF